MNNITWQDFQNIDIRCGTIVEVEHFEKAIKPAWKLKIDFGEIGIRKSSAQLTKLYQKQDLIGKQVIAVINFPPKQIANFYSECLVLGLADENEHIVLIQPERKVPNGNKIH